MPPTRMCRPVQFRVWHVSSHGGEWQVRLRTAILRILYFTDLDVPDVDTLVEGAAGDVPTIRTERHAVDGF